MKRRKFTEERIIGVPREHEAGVRPPDLCRKRRIPAIDRLIFGQCTREISGGKSPTLIRVKF